MTYRGDLPQCSLLHATVLPSRGGDTMIANMEADFENLSASLRTLLEQLNAVHDLVFGFNDSLIANQEFARFEKVKRRPELLCLSIHPAVGDRDRCLEI